MLPKKSLLRLPLQVLTLSNNRIIEIEKLALPTTVWYLDLKNNLIPEVSIIFFTAVFIHTQKLKNQII